MREFFALLVIVLTVSSCKQKAASSTTMAKPVTCSDPLNIIIRENAAVWCTEDMTAAHEISEATYRTYLSNRWSQIPATKNIEWRELNTLIGANTCYEKYVTFGFDADAIDNSSIKPDLTECFDRTKSCYSIPLLKRIVKDNFLTDVDVFECSIAKVDSLSESVIFAVLDRTKKVVQKRYYDVSVYPKLIEKRLHAMDQK